MSLPIVFLSVSDNVTRLARQVSKEYDDRTEIVDISHNPSMKSITEAFPDARVFITRGRRINELKELSGKSVVSIMSGVHDIIRQISDISSLGIKRIAVITIPEMIGHEERKYTIDEVEVIFCPVDEDKVSDTYHEMVSSGYEGFIGGLRLKRSARTRMSRSDSSRTTSIPFVKLLDLQIAYMKWRKRKEPGTERKTIK